MSYIFDDVRVDLQTCRVFSVADLAYTLAKSGELNEARRRLDELLKLAPRRYVSPYSIAMIFAELNEPEQAFAWLERARAARTDLI